MKTKPFEDLKFAIVGTKNAERIAELVKQKGGTSTYVSFSTQETRWESSISDFANRTLTAQFESVVFVTGFGVRNILTKACQLVPRQRLLDCLSDQATIAGSEQARQSLLEFGIEPTLSNTQGSSWREILILLDRKVRVANQDIAVEESAEILGLANGLEARGARIEKIQPTPVGEPDQPQQTLALFEQVEAADFHAILFADLQTAGQFCYVAKHYGRARYIGHLLDNQIVLAANEDIAELLQDRGIQVDGIGSNDPESLVAQFADDFDNIQKQKAMIRVNISGPATSTLDPNAPWYNNPFMKACRGEPTEVTPIWMMRQAGRYMAEYREVRDKVSFLELCANPQLCSEVMCTAVNKLGVDAAIIFSDLLPILVPMGCDLEFVKGDGPVIHNPVRTSKDIDRIRPLESNEPLDFVMETVRQTRNDLPADMPLIGFAGAPFTLASYMIEGGASRNYAHTKQLMFQDPSAWKQIMEHLSSSIVIYLKGQIEAGAQCVQLFDSWAGCLGFEDYRQFVHPYVKLIIASLPPNVPVINFATGNPALLPLLADTRAAVVGIDWRTRLDDAWQTVGYDRAVQGNLDPTVLLTDANEIRRQAKTILDQAAGRPGHIFNLGHGILPMTPVENAIALVDAVHELSQR